MGFRKCGNKNCEVCENTNSSDNFTSSVTGVDYKINAWLNCDSKCSIYLFSCKNCSKQYTGETVENFRFRWNNYKSNDRKF